MYLEQWFHVLYTTSISWVLKTHWKYMGNKRQGKVAFLTSNILQCRTKSRIKQGLPVSKCLLWMSPKPCWMCKPFTKYEQVENLVLISFQDKKLWTLHLLNIWTLYWSNYVAPCKEPLYCFHDLYFPVDDFGLKKMSFL